MNTTLLSNRENPHYFICSGGINIINRDTTLIDTLPFKDGKSAIKYAKNLGKNHFAVFATHMEWAKMVGYWGVK